MGDQFEDIAAKAVREARKVNCDKDRYVEGLETMISEIKEELAAAKECAR